MSNEELAEKLKKIAAESCWEDHAEDGFVNAMDHSNDLGVEL